MERNHPQDSPADNSVSPQQDAAASNLTPLVQLAGIESLPVLRVELKQAEDAVRMGLYDLARARLDQLLLDLGQLSTTMSREIEREPAQLCLLQASALVVSGQIEEQTEQAAQAQAALKQAVALFEQWLPPTVNALGTDYCNYGVALYKLERIAEARAPLQEAIKRGVPGATAYYYLGLLALSEGAYEQARDLLVRAAALEPGGVGIYVALAESWAALKTGAEAD